jgi:hypothetical protein
MRAFFSKSMAGFFGCAPYERVESGCGNEGYQVGSPGNGGLKFFFFLRNPVPISLVRGTRRFM